MGAPGFEPLPNVTLTIGSPRLPWHSCALILLTNKNDAKNIPDNLMNMIDRLPGKYTTDVTDKLLRNQQ